MGVAVCLFAFAIRYISLSGSPYSKYIKFKAKENTTNSGTSPTYSFKIYLHQILCSCVLLVLLEAL